MEIAGRLDVEWAELKCQQDPVVVRPWTGSIHYGKRLRYSPQNELARAEAACALLMASKTRKLPSVATGAVRFIQRGFHSIVFIEEVRAVVGRFQRGNVVVTLLAGKWGVDLVVAD